MNAPLTIGPGVKVRMHYTLSYADGTEIDSTQDGEPAEFVIGTGALAPGLERALSGMSAGQRERVLFGPGDAFGEHEAANIHSLPRADFAHMELSEGSVVSFALPTGDEIAGVITALNDDTVEVDFNHPLAGRALQFLVDILSVTQPD